MISVVAVTSTFSEPALIVASALTRGDTDEMVSLMSDASITPAGTSFKSYTFKVCNICWRLVRLNLIEMRVCDANSLPGR